MRRKVKRILAGILSIMLVMGMTDIPAKKVEAAGTPEFIARFTDADGKTIKNAHPGDEVQLILSVKNAGKLSGYNLRMIEQGKDKALTVKTNPDDLLTDEFYGYFDSLSTRYFTKYAEPNDQVVDGNGFFAMVYAVIQKQNYENKEIPDFPDMDVAVVKVKIADNYTGNLKVDTKLIEYNVNGAITSTEVNAITTATLVVEEQEIPATAINLDKDAMSLDLSGTNTGKLTTSYEPINTTDKGNTVTWKSDDESVATVDKEGNVTAVGKGTANITASIENAEGTTITSNKCKITVAKSVRSVTLDQKELGLKQGQEKILKATVTPNDADDATVTWESSAPDVVTVDQNGNVKAVAESGEAEITASTANGKSASCKVTVKTTHLDNVALNENNLSLAKGTEEKLTVAYTPDKGLITDELSEEKWESSNSDVATVDQDGNVKAVGKGTTEITYSVKADGVLKTVTAEVTVYVPVTGITITATPDGTLLKGTNKILSATLTPGDADSYDLEWSTSATNVELSTSPDGKTCTVTGKSEGTAIVTVKDKVSSVTAELPIKVIENKITSVNVTVEKSTLNKGDQTTATATITPNDTTDEKGIDWTSSNEKVATVDSKGKITAVGGGTTTISAISKARNNVSGTVEIIVKVPLQTISIGEDNIELVKGQETTLKIESFGPEDTTEDLANVAWDSSDKTVATVDANGNVKALKEGTTTIKATVAGKEASRKVTVKEYPLNGVELEKKSVTVDKSKGDFELKLLKRTEGDHDTTDTIKSVVWESSNPSVATVDGNAEKATIMPVGAGTTTITVRVTTDSNARTVYSATCEITVVIPLTGVEIYKDGNPITGGEMKLVKGNSLTLNASPIPADTTDDTTVTWTSSDPTSVSVDNTGVVTALKESSAPVTITAVTKNGKTATVTVVPKEIHIESISLSKDNIKLDLKELTASKEEKLTVSYAPENTTDGKKIKTWTTSDPTVATVADDGTVTAVGAGTATIKAVTENGKTATCEVTVEKHIDNITLTAEKTSINRNEEISLTTTINPEDATVDKTLEYSVDDESVLDIQKLKTDGIVKGLKAGTATVTVTAVNAPKTPSTSTTIEVVEDHASSDDFKFENDNPNGNAIRVDEKEPRIGLYYMEGAFTDTVLSYDYTVTDGDYIVSVDENGYLTFKARSGQATILATITVQDGSGQTRTIDKYYSFNLVEIPVEKISLDQNISLIVGENKTLTATFKPEDTTNKQLTWESSDPTVATVEAGEDGQVIVHALKAGEVTITATTTEAQKDLVAQTKITVKDKPVIVDPDKKPGQATGQSAASTKKPGDKNSQGSKKAVKTGDNSPILPVAATGMISLIVILSILILKKHRKAC